MKNINELSEGVKDKKVEEKPAEPACWTKPTE
jgi:hypothetical protein